MGGNSSITPEARIGGVPIQQSAEGTPVALLYGRNRLPVNLVWYGDFESVEKSTSQGGGKGGGVDTITYDYYASLISSIGQGPMSLINVWRGKSKYSAADASSKLGIGFMSGQQGQATWSHLSALPYTTQVDEDGNSYQVSTGHDHLTQAIGYSGTSYLYAQRYALDQGAQIPNHNVEVENTQFGSTPSPMTIAVDLLKRSGVPASAIGATADALAYAAGVGLYACPVYTSLSACADMVNDLATIGNVGLVSSEGLLKFLPYGASAVGAYVPNTTPAYNLTDDDFISSQDEDPIKVTRKSEADTYNHVKVQYADANREYNTAISEAKDDESIARSGLRTKDSITLNGITDANVARLVAQQILQREIALRNTYEFTLGARYARLEPMDYVTLTDSYLGLDKLVVRIIEIEDQDDRFVIKAEDAPMAAFTPAAYAFQKSAGFVGNYNAAPKNVTPPIFFQRPIKYEGGIGIVVRIAVTGPDATWGGCAVWMSVDGNNYRQLGQTKTRARYGHLKTSIDTTSTSLSAVLHGVGGQLLSGSAVDADSGSTLCWVGANGRGEYLSYQASTLQAANTYTLASLRRGQLNSTAKAYEAGAGFVRVDNNIFETETLPRGWNSKIVYFKFTSLNEYGGSIQSLADVIAYPYVLQHEPPSDVSGLGISVANNGILVTWDKSFDADYLDTELRIGVSWEAGTFVTRKASASHLLSWQLATSPLTLWARHRDTSLSYSTTAATCSLAISGPSPVVILRSDTQVNTVALGWNDAKTSQPIKSYSIYTGASGAALEDCALYGKAGADSRSDVVIFRSAGAKRIYLVAEDVAGNLSVPTPLDVNVTLPVNFVLSSEWDENWTGTKTNAYVDGDAIYLPVLDGETWSTHFSTRAWSNTDAQVAAGYPLVFEPSALSGSYVELHDIGKLMPSAKVSVAVQSMTLVGSVLPAVLIEWSADASTWKAGPSGVTEVQVSQVRYVRVTYSVTAVGGDDLVKLQRVHVVVSSEEKSEFAAITLQSTDASGTAYTTTKNFFDVVTAVFSPTPAALGGASPIARWSVYIDDSATPATPAKVYVMAWDASNNRVGGMGSLQIGGY
ncbi:phage tail protein [Limnohabitans sp.]|uniref:phage tail protein n=1 Tax=Limnohabitans sp. TaxID=1907725 RepID=UPI00286F4A4E|nr:phage tail protein [Limnohabitans sp.]